MSVDGCAWDDLVDTPAQIEGDPFSGTSDAIKDAMRAVSYTHLDGVEV